MLFNNIFYVALFIGSKRFQFRRDFSLDRQRIGGHQEEHDRGACHYTDVITQGFAPSPRPLLSPGAPPMMAHVTGGCVIGELICNIQPICTVFIYTCFC